MKKYEEFNLSDANATSIKQTIAKGYEFAKKAGEQHELTLATLKACRVSWSDISKAIIACYTDWPLNAKGDPKGIQKAIAEDDFEGAKALNRFQVYRNKYTDYGVKKESKKTGANTSTTGTSADSQPTVTKTTETVEKGATLQTKEEVTTSKAHTFDASQVSLYLSGIFGLPHVQNSPDLLASVQTLAEGLGVVLPEMPELLEEAV